MRSLSGCWCINIEIRKPRNLFGSTGLSTYFQYDAKVLEVSSSQFLCLLLQNFCQHKNVAFIMQILYERLSNYILHTYTYVPSFAYYGWTQLWKIKSCIIRLSIQQSHWFLFQVFVLNLMDCLFSFSGNARPYCFVSIYSFKANPKL